MRDKAKDVIGTTIANTAGLLVSVARYIYKKNV